MSTLFETQGTKKSKEDGDADDNEGTSQKENKESTRKLRGMERKVGPVLLHLCTCTSIGKT